MMTTAAELIDKQHLSHLAPLNILSPELLEQVMTRAMIKQLPPGQRVFNAGDDDNQAIFLLSGQLALLAEGQPTMIIKAGTRRATQAVKDSRPRQTTALASTRVTLLTIDADLLEQIVAENRITATRDNHHAMLSDNPHVERLLRGAFFYHLPLPYLRVLEQRLTERVVYEGETIINEGYRGDLYYLIAAGEACATRRTPQRGAVVDTTHLTQGEGFGEEAIIANADHTTNVHMTSDGVLLILTRHEYMTLILRPLIRWIDHSSALAMQKEGVTLLDTRMPNHFAAYNLPGSINLPLPVLRKTVSILNNTKAYIICTDNSTQGIFAAFILATHGLDVQLLKEGFEKKPATIATLPFGDVKVAP